MSLEMIITAFGGGQGAILAAIWWELRHLRKTVDDHETRLRQVERQRRAT